MEKQIKKSIDIDKIINECIFNLNSLVNKIELTNKIISHCNNLLNDLDEEKILTLLHIIDNYYKAIGLMKIISNDDVYNSCDLLIEKYISELFSNKKIYKKIKEIKKENSTKLIEMIYKNFYECKNEKVNKIFIEINNLKNNIFRTIDENVLCKPSQQHLTQYLTNIIPGLPSEFYLTKELYLSFQQKIENPTIRKYLEDIYNSKSKKVLNNFATLILNRHKYAINLQHKSYFDYVKQKGSVESIKNLINDLLMKIEPKSRLETQNIKTFMSKLETTKNIKSYKVSQSDYNYYYQNFITNNCNYLFKPVDIIKLLFEISEKMFGIIFKPATNNSKLWSTKIMTCKVLGIAKEELGYVYFDFYKTLTKKNLNPLCIKISGSPKKICLLTSYSDINVKCMQFNDVLLLFREFGCVLQMITHDKDELIVKNDEFDILMSQVMEYICWDKSIIEKICIGLDKNTINNFISLKYINFANLIKTKCISALFDHIIHNSHDLIGLLTNNSQNDIQSGEIIETLYKKIYQDIWNSQSDIFCSNINTIDPDIIIQEINGNEGTLYCNILTDILSYSIYTSIKNGHGKDFVKNVLSSKSYELRSSLNNFITNLQIDSYNLYLQKVIGYQNNLVDRSGVRSVDELIDNSINDLTDDLVQSNIYTNSKKNIPINLPNKTNMILTDTSANYFDDGEIIPDNELPNDNLQHDSDEIIILDKRKSKSK